MLRINNILVSTDLSEHSKRGTPATGGEEFFTLASQFANEKHIHVIPISRTGDPATGILNFAENIGAGCIVIGTHVRHGIERLFMGSVAESIIGKSGIPVLCVRTHNDNSHGNNHPTKTPFLRIQFREA